MKPVASDTHLRTPKRVAIIGAGLLGGSFGLALRKVFLSATEGAEQPIEMIGVSRSASSREAAIQSGAVTSATDCVEAACENADLVIVAVPVDGIVAMVLRATKHCSDDALVMDLGSTKASIVRAIELDERASHLFVATHPIAGSEKTGASFARADLFENKTVVLTPGVQTPSALVQRATSLWQAMQANVICMSAEQHDVAMASVSHVPHIVASMLAGILNQESAQQGAVSLVGSGWLDTTRVASGDPELWTAICRENSAAIQSELASAIEWLTQFSSKLSDEDFSSVRDLLLHSQAIRERVLASKQAPSNP
jgi:prephenate dehydrogenase